MGDEDLVKFVCGICGEKAYLKRQPEGYAQLPAGWQLGPEVRLPERSRDEEFYVCSGACKGRALEEAKPTHPGENPR